MMNLHQEKLAELFPREYRNTIRDNDWRQIFIFLNFVKDLDYAILEKYLIKLFDREKSTYFRGVFKTLSNIKDGAFCKNS